LSKGNRKIKREVRVSAGDSLKTLSSSKKGGGPILNKKKRVLFAREGERGERTSLLLKIKESGKNSSSAFPAEKRVEGSKVPHHFRQLKMGP